MTPVLRGVADFDSGVGGLWRGQIDPFMIQHRYGLVLCALGRVLPFAISVVQARALCPRDVRRRGCVAWEDNYVGPQG